jgi:hypothetical protein
VAGVARVAQKPAENITVRERRANPGRPLVLSLFDLTGHWARPWTEDSRFAVKLFDISRSRDEDVMLIKPAEWQDVRVLLAAPPCTLLAVSAAHSRSRHTSAERGAALALVRRTLQLVRAWRPRVWAIENPPGLMSHELRALPSILFHPWEFAGWLRATDPSLYVRATDLRDRYSKRTKIWGRFAEPVPRPLPRVDDWDGQTAISWIAPGPLRAQLRAQTPMGFARAFYAANVERALR